MSMVSFPQSPFDIICPYLRDKDNKMHLIETIPVDGDNICFNGEVYPLLIQIAFSQYNFHETIHHISINSSVMSLIFEPSYF